MVGIVGIAAIDEYIRRRYIVATFFGLLVVLGADRNWVHSNDNTRIAVP